MPWSARWCGCGTGTVSWRRLVWLFTCGSSGCPGWETSDRAGCGTVRRGGREFREGGRGQVLAVGRLTVDVQDEQVRDGHHECGQQGLGDAAVGEPVLWLGDVDAVALEDPVDPLVLGPDDLEGVGPGVGEVG